MFARREKEGSWGRKKLKKRAIISGHIRKKKSRNQPM